MESVSRFVEPRAVDYRDAILVAILGLVVNLVSAALLHEGSGSGHHHEHGHGHGHDHHHHGHDHNLRSAYFHVLADALTSVLAIAALAAGLFLGWGWLDPAVGIVGAIVIIRWSLGLMHDTAGVLLDRSPDPAFERQLRERVEAGGAARIVDLHVWTVGPGHYAAIVAVRGTLDAAEVRRRIGHDPRLAHVTVETA